MGIVHPCATEGCGTLTMGDYCIECEAAHRERGTRELIDVLKTLPAPEDQPTLRIVR